MLNSVEHNILNAHKYKNIKKFGFSKAQISAGSKGGAKGAHAPPPPPEATTRHTLPPGKKLIIDLMTPKASCKKMVPVRVANSNPIPTRLQSVKMVEH